MEDRHLFAYILVAGMLVVIGLLTARYFQKRRQFKLRQTGRGKNSGNVISE